MLGQIKKILLADDHDLIRQSTTEILESLGYQVAVFEDGQSAIDYYQLNYQDIDLIFLDMVMPNMTAKEFLTQAKTINPKANILLCTGSPDRQQINSLIREGAKDCLEKPYAVNKLAWAVRNALLTSSAPAILPWLLEFSLV